MAARAYWKGQIRLALVSIPVEIFTASKSGARISFNQIHEPTGKRINYEKVVRGVGPVDRDEIVKGFELSKGNYVLLDDEEIESVKLESKKTLELVQFVEQCEIDPLYYEKPFYVAPADELAEEAYIVLRDALRKSKKVGIGQLSVRGKEKLVSIKPCGNGMLLEMLRYADEVKKGQEFFHSIPDDKPSKELLDMAGELIEKRSAPFDATEFEDRYSEALRALVDKKAKSKSARLSIEEEESEVTSGNVIDLMAALKKSVKEEKAKPKSSTSSAKKKKSA